MSKRIGQPLVIFLGCVLILILVSPAWSQNSDALQKVDPGTVRQSLEKKTIRQPAAMPDITIETDEGKKIDGAADATFVLEEILFDGNDVISSRQLETIVRPYYDSDISVLTLQAITEKITSYYIEQGYILSRAYLPPQEIKNGRVLIRIREGSLGRIIVKGNERYMEEVFNGVMEIVRKRGAVRRADLERALLLLMDYPAMEVRADLMAGERPGTTDIVVHVEESKWWGLGIDYNNFGSEFVGSDRVSLKAALYSPLGWGDAFRFNFTSGDIDELFYGRIEYTVPINYSGTNLGFSYSRLESDASGILAESDIEGAGDYASIWLSHPVVRSRTFNWWVNGGLDYDRSTNEILGDELYDDQLINARIGTQIQWVDNFIGNNSLLFDVVQGLSNEDVESTLDAESQFTKFELGYSRYQLLPTDFLRYNAYAIFTVNGMFSTERLPSSQRLHIGGAGTVRGYEQSEHSGDRGVYGTLEFRLPVWKPEVEWNWLRPLGNRAELQLATFIDSGYVEIEDARVSEIGHVDITGAGLGLRFELNPTMLLRIDWAHHIAGEDPDVGHYDDDGVWYIQFSAFY